METGNGILWDSLCVAAIYAPKVDVPVCRHAVEDQKSVWIKGNPKIRKGEGKGHWGYVHMY